MTRHAQREEDGAWVANTLPMLCHSKAEALRNVCTMLPALAHVEIIRGLSADTVSRITSIVLTMQDAPDLAFHVQEIRALVEDAGILDDVNGVEK